MRNWAGNHEYLALKIHAPRSVDELRELVARSPKVRALGTRHSFNDIADTPGELISLEHFDRVVKFDLDGPRPSVTVQGCATYGKLACELHVRGFAVHNLASLPHISIAGACATATHGSGDRNAILGAAVRAMQIVKADGDVVELSREKDGDEFSGAVVGLGALGMVTQLTLDVSPAFQMRQEVFENLPMEAANAHFDAIFSSAYSVSFFLDWRGPRINQVWMKRRVDEGEALKFDPREFGATAAKSRLHPLPGCDSENCTEQLGIPGPWHERLPHFRMDFTPSSGQELQSEFFVPRDCAAEAMAAVYALRERVSPLLHISEIRSIAADEFWMSPFYKAPRIGIHFTWKPDWEGVREVLPSIEQALAPFDARPHWGKLFTMSPRDLQSRYAKLKDFRELIATFDPKGKFNNTFLDRCIGTQGH